MSRYIDAEALEKRRIDYIVDGYADSVDDMVEWGMAIIEAPSIDIVRCKECKWASPNKEGDYDCKCHIPIFRVDAEGYCYLADRKESE